MPWKYCENCDKDEILIDTILEMKALLTEIKNKLSL